MVVASGKCIVRVDAVRDSNYLHDITCDNDHDSTLTIPAMNSFIDSAVISETLVENCDTKLAIWSSMLPACKKDPLRPNGQVDEVMYATVSAQ
jgi:hypothetical protein